MADAPKGWLGTMLNRLEDAKISTVPTTDNVVPITPQQLTKLHDAARKSLSVLASIHAEGHALMIREHEEQERLKMLQQQIIEAVAEVRIKGVIVEPSNE